MRDEHHHNIGDEYPTHGGHHHQPPPLATPQKPYHHHRENNRRQLLAVITILVLLLAFTALFIWLIYRPSKPHFTAVSTTVNYLNTTSSPPYVAASLHITVLAHNPSKRTSLYYDNLAVALQYHNHPIAPPVPLPPLNHIKQSTVIISPEIGGGPAVAVPPDVAEGMATDEMYGVVGLSWVLMGRVKYRAGWFSSGNNKIYVRCDVMLGFKTAGKGGNLLGSHSCFVHM